MLEDLRLTDAYKKIKLFNYKSDNLWETLKQCCDHFIVIDNAQIFCLIMKFEAEAVDGFRSNSKIIERIN